jgi:hypothetical protein
MRSFLLAASCSAMLIFGCKQPGIKNSDGTLVNEITPARYQADCYKLPGDSEDFLKSCKGKQIVWDATVERAVQGNYQDSPNGLIRVNVRDPDVDGVIVADLVIGRPPINPNDYPEGVRLRFVGLIAGRITSILEVHNAHVLKIYQGASQTSHLQALN